MSMNDPMPDPKCEGCGKRPEVHGSSWCAHCHDTLPRYVQYRMIRLRNGLIDIALSDASKTALRDMAVKAYLHADQVSGGQIKEG